MALKISTETMHGEVRDLYVRLIVATQNNHGQPTDALFRGFLSKEFFEAGRHFVWEKEIKFQSRVNSPLWEQAYLALSAEIQQEFADGSRLLADCTTDEDREIVRLSERVVDPQIENV